MRIDLGYWPLGEFVAQGENFVVKIVFQLVPVQPALTDVDLRIFQYCSSVCSESVSNFGAPDSRDERPDKWEETGEDSSQERRPLALSPWEESGSLHIVEPFLDDRLCQARDLSRIVLTIACHYNDYVESVGQRVPVSLFDRVTYSIPRGVLDDRDRNLGPLSRLIDFF